MFVMNESQNVQCSYNILYTMFGMMYIFLGLLQQEGTKGRCCYIGQCSCSQGPELELMMLFEMMTNKWLSCWRLAKYLKKFTDVQLFPYLLSIQRGLNRMLGFFLAMGVGRNLIMDQTFKRKLTLLSGRGSPEGSENLARSKGVA